MTLRILYQTPQPNKSIVFIVLYIHKYRYVHSDYILPSTGRAIMAEKGLKGHAVICTQQSYLRR